jgi:lipoyl(octanoyl) transferase
MNHDINKKVIFQSLGLIDYQQAWNYQEKIFAAVVAQKVANRHVAEALQKPTPNYLLFCQHPHVFTLGKSGLPENLL